MENIGEQFLHQKDSKLHTSESVEHEQDRKKLKGEGTSQKPREKISSWMSVLERTHLGHREDSAVWQRIKNYYHDEHVVKPEDIQESVFLLEQRIAREMGHGDVEITEEFRERKIEQIVSDQKESLNRWLDYLASGDAVYPMWAKYWAFTSLVQMGKFEKVEEEKGGHKVESGRFAKRTKNTASPFPTLNPRALAMTIGVMQSKLDEAQKQKEERNVVENKSTKLGDSDFEKLLSTENFSKIYTQFLIEMPEYSAEGLQETRGKWVKYPKNSDAKPLVDSLQGYPLEWCTANLDTAKTQLQGGDFYVYYSFNTDGEATIPRLAIRMQEGSIAEVRGIAPNQNVDPYISDVAKAKMKEFPDGLQYEKKSEDMKQLTEIEKKQNNGKELTKEDLVFLYEIEDQIEGFGYEKDPRVSEIVSQRDKQEDAPIVLGCLPEEIAWSEKDIDENTKSYIGPLFSGVFTKDFDYVFTSFPEGKIQKYNINIGGKTKTELRSELEEKKVYVSPYAKDLLNSKDFDTSNNIENLELVRLTVDDLGFQNGATTDEIYKRAEDFGLELCPAEVGPQLRLAYSGGDWMYIAMKQIADRYDYPNVFYLSRDGARQGLFASGARPTSRWGADSRFVFRIRKS